VTAILAIDVRRWGRRKERGREAEKYARPGGDPLEAYTQY